MILTTSFKTAPEDFSHLENSILPKQKLEQVEKTKTRTTHNTYVYGFCFLKTKGKNPKIRAVLCIPSEIQCTHTIDFGKEL